MIGRARRGSRLGVGESRAAIIALGDDIDLIIGNVAVVGEDHALRRRIPRQIERIAESLRELFNRAIRK